jgi:hypothetical protein
VLDEGASYPPGACHFPQYGEEYFKQLNAERLVTRIVKGSRADHGRRNQAGVTRRSTAGSMLGRPPPSAGSTGSTSVTGGEWRKRWRAIPHILKSQAQKEVTANEGSTVSTRR